MKKILILAILLRVLLAAFFFHPDIKTYNFQSSFLKRGVFNIYSYLSEHKQELTLKEEFVYPPFTYLVLGGYQIFTSPVLGRGFDSWLANAESNSFVRDPNIFRYLLVLKLPYLLLDILIAFLLREFFKDKKSRQKAFTVWLFNPFTIILLYVFSNIDIFPAALSVGAFLLIKKGKATYASFLLGLASGFKVYPLLFIPFLFAAGRNLKQKIFLAILPLLIFGLISLSFISPSFVQSALVSGLTTRIFNPGINIGMNETIIASFLGISLLFFYATLQDKKINLLNYWISLFLLIFSFSHFHIQWLLWIAPFVLILAVKKPNLSLPIFFLSLIAFLIPIFYEDRFMTVGLLRVYSTLYDILPTPFSLLQKFYDPYNLQSILHSTLAAGSLVLIYKIFKKGAV